MIRKQEALQAEQDRSKLEAREARMKARQTVAAARDTSPTPSMAKNPDEEGEEDDGNAAAEQLSDMREHLQKQQDGHDAAWNDMIEA